MKKIKFRLWFEGKMIYPHETHGAGSSAMQYTIDLSGNVDYRNVYGLDNEAVKNCDAAIKLQYTGLKDKNGKEIYEGDICMINPDDDNWIDVVVRDRNWIELSTYKNKCVTNCSLYEMHDQIEVIGNIYENPLQVE